MANADFFNYGFQDPNNIGSHYFGDPRSKGGQGNMLSFLSGQNQAKINPQRQRTESDRSDLMSKYGAISSGDYQGINPEESTTLDQLGAGYRNLNSDSAMQDYTKGVLTPLGGVFNQARQAAGNRVARTGNSAGYGSLISELSREQGRQSSQAGFQIGNEKYNRDMATQTALTGLANTRFQRNDAGFSKQMEGVRGLAQMYGVDLDTLNALYTQQSTLYQQGAANSKTGVLDYFKALAPVAGAAIGAFA